MVNCYSENLGMVLIFKVLFEDFIWSFNFYISMFLTIATLFSLFFCRQLSVWMVMAAKFELDLLQLQVIPTLIHQLLAIHVIYGKVDFFN